MADANTIKLYTYSAGTQPWEMGQPRLDAPLLRAQCADDTLRVVEVRIVPLAPAATIIYRTGGLPLAIEEGGAEITPDASTPYAQYKFSAWFGEQMGISNYNDAEHPRIVSVEAAGRLKIGADFHYVMYDSVKDKVRLFDVATGAEAAEDDVVVDEDDAAIMRLRVIYF